MSDNMKFKRYDQVPIKTILRGFVEFCCTCPDCGIYDSLFGGNEEKIINEYVESIFPKYSHLEILSKRENKPSTGRFEQNIRKELNGRRNRKR